MSGNDRKKVTSLFDECYCFDCKKCRHHKDECDCEVCRLCKKCCEIPETKEVNLIKDNICGNITSPCDGTVTTLWRTPLSSTFGTVSIFYGNGCDKMDVFINDRLAFTLNKGQTQSVTLPGLMKVAVKCIGGNSFCTGTYCLDLHYMMPRHKPGNDEEDCGCM